MSFQSGTRRTVVFFSRRRKNLFLLSVLGLLIVGAWRATAAAADNPSDNANSLSSAGVLTLYASLTVNLQNTQREKGNSVWEDLTRSELPARYAASKGLPDAYRTLKLNESALREALAAAPLELSAAAKNNTTVIELPLPDGTFGRFRIVESPIMEADLAARFPEIKTYSGQGIDDPTATVRFDLTPQGFHATLLSAQATMIIAPFAQGDTTHYLSYFFVDASREALGMSCETDPLQSSDETPEKQTNALSAPAVPLAARCGRIVWRSA